MIAFAPGAALAATPIESVSADAAVLWVGVHREAGVLSDVAADGASGQCVSEQTWIRCPAAGGPVTFRWGRAGDDDWRLYGLRPDGGWSEGPIVVPPGQGAAAVVLAAEASRDAELARLQPGAVTAQDLRSLFVRTGDHPVFPPSPSQLQAVAALVTHPDPVVRRELPDVLLPWMRHTSLDPLPMGAPPVIPAGTMMALAEDRDPAVRRRLASRLRDVRDGPQASDEVNAALLHLVSMGGGAQRAAMVAVGSRSKEGVAPALEAWRLARLRMRDPGPPGRAAIKTLVALATAIEAGGEVDPAAAVRDCLVYHPEKTWSLWHAWRREVPLDEEVLLRLFRDTVGWSPTLLKYWARGQPDALEVVFRRWEPGTPHTDRYLDLIAGLALLPDPRWAALRGDNLSSAQPPPPAP